MNGLIRLHDAAGNTVAANQSPGDVRDLPFADRAMFPALEVLPAHIEARLLDGNWYGYGPEIILWDAASELQVSVPASSSRATISHRIRGMSRVAKRKRRGEEPKNGGYRVRCG